MRTLTIVPQPAPTKFPDMDMNGIVATTATVTPKKGDPYWVCNPMSEIIEAMEAGEPFVAHKVVALQPKQIVIMPGTIHSIEEA